MDQTKNFKMRMQRKDVFSFMQNIFEEKQINAFQFLQGFVDLFVVRIRI